MNYSEITQLQQDLQRASVANSPVPDPDEPDPPHTHVANVVRVVYDAGSGAYPERPEDATHVEWVGPTTPPAAVPYFDTWIEAAI